MVAFLTPPLTTCAKILLGLYVLRCPHTKLIGPLASQLCIALSKHSKRPQPWAVECSTWPSSCSHPFRQVLAHFTYLRVQSRPGKLPTISLSPSRLGSSSPFPVRVGAPYPHSLPALSSLPLIVKTQLNNGGNMYICWVQAVSYSSLCLQCVKLWLPPNRFSINV